MRNGRGSSPDSITDQLEIVGRRYVVVKCHLRLLIFGPSCGRLHRGAMDRSSILLLEG